MRFLLKCHKDFWLARAIGLELGQSPLMDVKAKLCYMAFHVECCQFPSSIYEVLSR